MKWNKFKTLAAENLKLGPVINWHIGPSMQLSSQELRTWIEDKVEYIAIRPWESLDFDDKSTQGYEFSREYCVWFRIENQGVQHWRLKGSFIDEINSPVSGLIHELKVWHSEYWAKQPGNHSLVIEVITSHQKTWGESKSRFLEYESLDIYIPPQGYTP